jgi:hypothetical protein
MAAAMCAFGHIGDDIESFRMEDCMLCMPTTRAFFLIDRDDGVGSLQGCYLYYDWSKFRWIRSGKTSGDGAKACFHGRGDTHKKNARSVEEMKTHQFYAFYPAKKVETIGKRRGYFDDLSMYCGMAFDPKDVNGVSNLCSNGEIDSLFVWSNEVMEELEAKGGVLRKVQLDALAYLWELCYDLLLAEGHNVSVSPGFESLGLRVNRARKRKEYD